jgi:hypothetical protein
MGTILDDRPTERKDFGCRHQDALGATQIIDYTTSHFDLDSGQIRKCSKKEKCHQQWIHTSSRARVLAIWAERQASAIRAKDKADILPVDLDDSCVRFSVARETIDGNVEIAI